MGPKSYQLTWVLPFLTWDRAIWKFNLENPRSRSYLSPSQCVKENINMQNIVGDLACKNSHQSKADPTAAYIWKHHTNSWEKEKKNITIMIKQDNTFGWLTLVKSKKFLSSVESAKICWAWPNLSSIWSAVCLQMHGNCLTNHTPGISRNTVERSKS